MFVLIVAHLPIGWLVLVLDAGAEVLQQHQGRSIVGGCPQLPIGVGHAVGSLDELVLCATCKHRQHSIATSAPSL